MTSALRAATELVQRLDPRVDPLQSVRFSHLPAADTAGRGRGRAGNIF